MGSKVRVVVYERGIQALFEPGGAVHREADKVGADGVRFAKANLFARGHGLRTGRLRKSVRRVGRGIMKRFHYAVSVGSNEKHAMWVERGTTGPIYPRHGFWLAVGKREGKKPIWRMSVQGQRGQHYLRRGVSTALVKHGYGPLQG